MATPRRRSSRIKGETPVSKHRWQLDQASIPLYTCLMVQRKSTDRVIVSVQYHTLSKQAILPNRAGRVPSKRRPTLAEHHCLFSSRPSKHCSGAIEIRCPDIASENASDSFTHAAVYARNAPKQSPPKYYQAIGISSGLRQYLFSHD